MQIFTRKFCFPKKKRNINIVYVQDRQEECILWNSHLKFSTNSTPAPNLKTNKKPNNHGKLIKMPYIFVHIMTLNFVFHHKENSKHVHLWPKKEEDKCREHPFFAKEKKAINSIFGRSLLHTILPGIISSCCYGFCSLASKQVQPLACKDHCHHRHHYCHQGVQVFSG